MTGSAADQMALLVALEAYERGEALAQWFREIRCLAEEADRRHQAMFNAALDCGFEPGGRHSHMTSLEWSRQRAETIRRVLPNNVRQQRKDAA